MRQKKPGKNRAEVNTIENRLTDLTETLKSSPTSDAKEIKNRNSMLEFVELILYFNQQNQVGKGLKLLTQMFSRLPISVAQLKARKSSEKLKN